MTRTASAPPRRAATRPSTGVAAVVALVLAAAGVWLGVEVDALVHGSGLRAAALANATAPYAVLVAVIAMLRRSPARAALDGGVFFAAFVLAYYGALARRVGVAAVNVHYAGVWLVIALVLCPVLCAALCWARRRRGVLRAVVFALPAAGCLAEALVGRTWGMAGVLADVVIACDLLTAAGFVVIVPRGIVTRFAAAAWTVPCTIGAVVLVQHLGNAGAYDRWMY